MRAVEIEHPDQPIARNDRHDQFRSARRIARDMARKGVDVRDELRRPIRRGGAAHAAAARDPDARRLALKRPEHQLPFDPAITTEERRVRKEGGSQGRTRWSCY